MKEDDRTYDQMENNPEHVSQTHMLQDMAQLKQRDQQQGMMSKAIVVKRRP